MSGDEEFWGIGLYFGTNGLVVFAGITANVGYPDGNIFAQEFIMQWKFHPGFAIIDVAVYCSQGF